MEAADEPCDGMEPQESSPALCQAHCADPAKTFEPVKLPTLTPPAIVQVLALPGVPQTQQQARIVAPRAPAAEARPPPDPLFLSTRRLRV
jgi:hypothetical protein